MEEKTRHIIKAISFTIFIFSLLGGIYILGNAWFHPETLKLPLTHHLSWPREDNFAVFSWIVSFISFLIWSLVRK